MGEPTSTEGLSLDQLQLFLAVIDSGGFSAAARSLRRAQSAVSYGIANLERQLGVVLFDRTAPKPALTRAGEELAIEARAVGAQVDRLRARAHGIAQGVEPRLVVAVDHMFPLPALVVPIVLGGRRRRRRSRTRPPRQPDLQPRNFPETGRRRSA